MTTRTTLAVVMATYQGARWLPAQLASIAGQTRPPDLLVVSDDGSTDGTSALLRDFAASAPFEVRLLGGPRTGLGDNFWSAARAADCDLIAWSDQDDVWHPDKLARCEAALRRAGALFVSHSATVTDGALAPLGRRRYPDHRRTGIHEPLSGDPWAVPSGFASVFHRSLLDDVDWPSRPVSHQTGRAMNHDHVVSLRAFAGARRVELRDALALYRQHGANVAGDPSTRGLGSLTTALSVGAVQFRSLAGVAEAYGSFVAGLDVSVDDAGPYFEELARRCRRRAAVYEVGRPADRLRSLSRAAGARVYRGKTAGGFGSLALAKDMAAIALGTGR